MKNLLLLLQALGVFAMHMPAHAGPGHDHGDETAPVAGNIAPRFSAHSELFELLGVVREGRITLYLDRYADNAPVTEASIELEIKPAQGDALKLKAVKIEDGAFAVDLVRPLAAGAHAITATIGATLDGKAESDLLAATLELAPGKSAGERESVAIAPYAWAGGGTVVLLGFLTLWWRRRAGAPRVLGASR
ncbi:MAG: hypothetical protein JNM79_22035 [Burkholderiales bacterium]|nr:hypothetical protein [Burkholderiales bacterium]